MHCPGHAGVKRNNHADRLAGKATLTRGLLLRKSEVLRSLRQYLRAQSQGHHSIDRLEERGMERGRARWSSLKGRERAIINQMKTGTVSKAALGKLLRDGVEHIWAFPNTQIPSWTELNWTEQLSPQTAEYTFTTTAHQSRHTTYCNKLPWGCCFSVIVFCAQVHVYRVSTPSPVTPTSTKPFSSVVM